MSLENRHFYEFGRYRLMPAERLLLLNGRPVSLTPKAFATLVVLVSRAGRLVDKNELLAEVWPGTSVEESNIAQNVFALRRALKEGDEGVEYIETVPKRGYRFVAAVTVYDDEGGDPREPRPVGPESVVLPPSGLVTPGATSDYSAPAEPVRRKRRGRAVAATAVVIVVLLTLAAAGIRSVIAGLRSAEGRDATSPPLSVTRLISDEAISSAAISPDGRYVAHVVEHAGRSSILMRQVSTVTDLPVVPPEESALWGLTFSRDGDSLYFVRYVASRGNSLYRVSVLGGPTTKILEHVDSPIGLSPDGRRIAFVRDSRAGENQLIVAAADGTNARVLATRRASTAFSSSPRGGPAWSPDGRFIANGVISLEGGYHGFVVTVGVSDGVQRPLTSQKWYQVAQVAWLPNGGLVIAARESSHAQLWRVAYPGGEARRITADLDDYHGISLTAGAQVLTTVQYDRQSTLDFVPSRPPADTTRNTQGADEGVFGVAWTPGGEVVYASEASGNGDLWLVAADGVTTRQLTTDPEHDGTPSVSPDGRSIVFISRRAGGNPHVWQMRIDGSGAIRLTNHDSEGTPSYTPDGRFVVYAAAGTGVWKVPSSGEGAPVLLIGGGRVRCHTPSVSPDGKRVVCAYSETGEATVRKLALVSLESSQPAQLIDYPEDYAGPTTLWTSDSRALVYVSRRNDLWNVRSLPLDGSAAQDLTSGIPDRIFNFALSRDGTHIALARGTTNEHVVLLRNF